MQWLLTVVAAACLLQGAWARAPAPARAQLGITGGRLVKIQEVPFQVSLEQLGEHVCGGSILSKDWVLTAARCLFYVDEPASNAVRYGTDVKQQGGTLVAVSWTGYHDKYDMPSHSHDVAVVKVAEPIVFSDTARPVRLPAVGVLPLSTDTLSVTGWGTKTYYDIVGPSELRGVTVPYVPRPTCRISYVPQGRVIDDSMICAGVRGKDACMGDSGGPLVNGLGVQVGVVSWGIGCGSPGYAGVYADLSYSLNRDWIRNITSLG